MVVFDSNVVIDVLTRSPRWFEWSSGQIVQAAQTDGAVINTIVLAELSPGYDSLSELMRNLDSVALRVMEIGAGAGYSAGRAFAAWRRARSPETARRVLPDFLIGAHAQSLGAALATRDRRIYETYFPELTLITPETEHG